MTLSRPNKIELVQKNVIFQGAIAYKILFWGFILMILQTIKRNYFEEIKCDRRFFVWNFLRISKITFEILWADKLTFLDKKAQVITDATLALIEVWFSTTTKYVTIMISYTFSPNDIKRYHTCFSILLIRIALLNQLDIGL